MTDAERRRLAAGAGLVSQARLVGGLLNMLVIVCLTRLLPKPEFSVVAFVFLPPTLMPSFVVDVTPWHEEWLASIYAHESQFGRADQNPGIRDFFGANAMRWGRQARGKYAQAFYSPWPIALDSVMTAAGMDGLQA